jgi:hypothetical protein
MPRSGLISITTGEARGKNTPETSALKGLNINKFSPFRAESYGCMPTTGFTRGYMDQALSGLFAKFNLH